MGHGVARMALADEGLGITKVATDEERGGGIGSVPYVEAVPRLAPSQEDLSAVRQIRLPCVLDPLTINTPARCALRAKGRATAKPQATTGGRIAGD